MSLSPLSEFFLIHSLFLSCFTQEDIPSRLYLMPVVVCHHICSQFKLKKGTVDHLDPSIHSVISLDPVFKNSTYFYMMLNIIFTSCYFYIASYCMLTLSISPKIIEWRIYFIFTIIPSQLNNYSTIDLFIWFIISTELLTKIS